LKQQGRNPEDNLREAIAVLVTIEEITEYRNGVTQTNPRNKLIEK